MNFRELLVFFAQQIWQIPFLVIYILGLILAFNHREIGKGSTYAALGFAALILAQCVGALQGYLMMQMRADGSHDLARMAYISTSIMIPRTLLGFAGMGLVLAAIFARRPSVSPS